MSANKNTTESIPKYSKEKRILFFIVWLIPLSLFSVVEPTFIITTVGIERSEGIVELLKLVRKTGIAGVLVVSSVIIRLALPLLVSHEEYTEVESKHLEACKYCEEESVSGEQRTARVRTKLFGVTIKDATRKTVRCCRYCVTDSETEIEIPRSAEYS